MRPLTRHAFTAFWFLQRSFQCVPHVPQGVSTQCSGPLLADGCTSAWSFIEVTNSRCTGRLAARHGGRNESPTPIMVAVCAQETLLVSNGTEPAAMENGVFINSFHLKIKIDGAPWQMSPDSRQAATQNESIRSPTVNRNLDDDPAAVCWATHLQGRSTLPAPFPARKRGECIQGAVFIPGAGAVAARCQ